MANEARSRIAPPDSLMGMTKRLSIEIMPPQTIEEARKILDESKTTNKLMNAFEYGISRLGGLPKSEAELSKGELLIEKQRGSGLVALAKQFVSEWSEADKNVADEELERDKYLESMVIKCRQLKQQLVDQGIKGTDKRWKEVDELKDQIRSRVMKMRRE